MCQFGGVLAVHCLSLQHMPHLIKMTLLCWILQKEKTKLMNQKRHEQRSMFLEHHRFGSSGWLKRSHHKGARPRFSVRCKSGFSKYLGTFIQTASGIRSLWEQRSPMQSADPNQF
eukprot:5137096-Amphidinium_carterae.1